MVDGAGGSTGTAPPVEEPLDELPEPLVEEPAPKEITVTMVLLLALCTYTRSLTESNRTGAVFPKDCDAIVPNTLFEDEIGPTVLGPAVLVSKREIAPTSVMAGEMLFQRGDRSIKLFCWDPPVRVSGADDDCALPTSSLVVDPWRLLLVVTGPAVQPVVPLHQVTAPTLVALPLRSH